MLHYLSIKNFALIDEYELAFEPGMSVLTGETGAGKSILLDALSLCLGARADSKMIRQGATRCDIAASFSIDDSPPALNWLQEQSLLADSDCLLRRTITSDGKSRAFINGQPVTLQQLSALGALLVDIHGQHEHHFLLKKEHQLFLLDEFAENRALLTEINTLYTQWLQLEKEKDQLQQLTHHEREEEFIRFQLQELEELQLMPDEVSQLEREHKMLTQSEDVIHRVQGSVAGLLENEENIVSQLKIIQQKIAPLESMDPTLANALHNLNQADVFLQEATFDLRHYLSHLDLNPERLTEITHRLEHIYRLARKHRVLPEDLTPLTENLTGALKLIAQAETQATQIAEQQALCIKQYQTCAKRLSEKRIKAAKKLAQTVTTQMQKLAMTGGIFTIQFYESQDTIHPRGQERCEFWVQPNPGQAAQPLSKIASGGELSRISLAIQVILAAHHVVPTLIFDEVDVGIGGTTATIVGQLLQQLGQQCQILCVTHLPQVAVFGHQHYQVEKMIIDNETRTALNKLSEQTRKEEIARMLGGMAISKQSLAHAEELLQQALSSRAARDHCIN